MLNTDASPRRAARRETPATTDVWLIGMDDDLLDLLAATVSHARNIAPIRLHLAEAEARLETDRPSLAIVDLGEPVDRHVRLVRVLRRRAVPLVILTSRDGEVDGFAKPFSPTRLLARIEQLLTE